MSDPSVSERRIKPIQDAVESENWKQALQLCEKWQKKGERSDRFQAIKGFVLVKQQDKSLHERGVNETIQLCNRTPPITDLEAIRQIQATLAGLSIRGGEGTRLWERAIIARPDSGELPMLWLRNSLSQNDWLNGQKAAMALRKGFPKDRNYDFWNILMCYLIHKDPSLPKENRQLFGTLAYRLISKAAEAVPPDPTQLLSAGKAIQTAEELYLLVNIYLSTGHSAEAVALLQSDTFGLRSRFAKQDSQLVTTLLLDALEAAKAWEELFAVCERLLHDNAEDPIGTFDDYRVWELLLLAANNSSNPNLVGDSGKIISATIYSRPSLRSAHRANLTLVQSKFLTGSSAADLLHQCKTYFKMFCDKKFCYEDLRSAVHSLDRDNRRNFLEHLDILATVPADHEEIDAKDINSHLNVLKLEYSFLLSTNGSEKELEAFACKALRTYQKSLTNSDSWPEAALLSAMTLIRLAYLHGSSRTQTSNQHTHLLQAAFLLQDCLLRTDDYYPYRILLLQIESMLGLASVSMKRFKQLNVKNLQWETVGHLLLTRISTLHPSSVGMTTPSDDTGIDPLQAIHAALAMTDGSGESLGKQIQSGLHAGSYVNVIESLDMRSNLEHSITREIFCMEQTRLQRILNLPENGEILTRRFPLVDKRDFSYFPNFEAPDSPAFVEYLRCGPVPKEIWLNVFALYDNTIRFLKGELYGHSIPFSQQLDAIRNLLLPLMGFNKLQLIELSHAESYNFEVHLNLASATTLLKETGPLEPSDNAQFEKHIGGIEAWLQQTLADDVMNTEGGYPGNFLIHLNGQVMAPSWEYLHWNFSVMESLQSITLLLAVMAKKPKNSSKGKGTAAAAALILKDQISRLQKLVGAVEKRVQDGIRKLKAGINAPGVLGQLLETGLGRAAAAADNSNNGDDEQQSAMGKQVEDLANAASLETYCGAMRDSWDDALDGILAVRLKVYK